MNLDHKMKKIILLNGTHFIKMVPCFRVIKLKFVCALKGVFAKNEGGYRFNAIKIRI